MGREEFRKILCELDEKQLKELRKWLVRRKELKELVRGILDLKKISDLLAKNKDISEKEISEITKIDLKRVEKFKQIAIKEMNLEIPL